MRRLDLRQATMADALASMDRRLTDTVEGVKRLSDQQTVILA